MQLYRYSDEHISQNELMFTLPGVIVGISILTLPAQIAKVTSFSDGWISILISGVLLTIVALIGLKVATTFPNKSFYEYTSYLVTKPIAIIIMTITILTFIAILSYLISQVSFVTQRYMFVQTPMEAIGLTFLLVVIYAVAGSRAALFRLNMLFIPINLCVFTIIIILNFKWYDLTNSLPLFQTDMKGYLKGIAKSSEAFGGFSIVLFYTFLIYQPKGISKKVIIGMSIPTILYIAVFLMCIATFGNQVTENLIFPTIEAAKRIDIPGAVFERIDAFVFTVWIMGFFTTAIIIFDIIILLLSSVIKKVNKHLLIFILSPIIFYLSMFPQQFYLSLKIGSIVNKFHLYFISSLILMIFIIMKIRGVSRHESS